MTAPLQLATSFRFRFARRVPNSQVEPAAGDLIAEAEVGGTRVSNVAEDDCPESPADPFVLDHQRKHDPPGWLVRPPGFEPGTCGLRVRCSAIELEARR
jgi:hypothetical protein